jgi:hypothetical protein
VLMATFTYDRAYLFSQAGVGVKINLLQQS